MSVILGIDPGAHGCIATLDEDGRLLDVVDMPSTPEANGRTATNPSARRHSRALPRPRRLLRIRRR